MAWQTQRWDVGSFYYGSDDPETPAQAGRRKWISVDFGEKTLWILVSSDIIFMLLHAGGVLVLYGVKQ